MSLRPLLVRFGPAEDHTLCLGDVSKADRSEESDQLLCKALQDVGEGSARPVSRAGVEGASAAVRDGGQERVCPSLVLVNQWEGHVGGSREKELVACCHQCHLWSVLCSLP